MADFQEWLQAVSTHFQHLTDEQRNHTLSYLLNVCSPAQLTYLTCILPSLLYRDFLRMLPVEISTVILQYLDISSLFNCSLVSKHWHNLVNSLSEVWQLQCLHLGIIDLHSSRDAAYYKRLFLKVSALQVEPLKAGQAFVDTLLTGHHSRVMAIHYHDGKIVTGSDDHTVKVWDCHTEECGFTLHTQTVSDVRLENNFIYTSSFDGSAESWQIPQGFHKRYIGHVSAVFSIDICLELSILVSGSADLTMKVWDISSAQLLATLAGHHKGWVVKVKVLSHGPNHPYTLVSADKKICCIWEMSFDHQVSQVQLVHHPDHQIVPHLLFKGTHLMRICFMSDDGKHGFINTYRLDHNLTLIKHHKLPHSVLCVQLLLGVGSKFALVLNKMYGEEYLSVFKLHNNKLIMRKPFPAIRPTSGGTSVTVGPTDWLDGFTSDPPTGVVLGACLKNHNIYLLKWNCEIPEDAEEQFLKIPVRVNIPFN